MIAHEHVPCKRCSGHGSIERVHGLAMRELRIRAELTLEYVSGRLGISIGHLSDMELGKRTMSEETAERIVEICGQRTGIGASDG